MTYDRLEALSGWSGLEWWIILCIENSIGYGRTSNTPVRRYIGGLESEIIISNRLTEKNLIRSLRLIYPTLWESNSAHSCLKAPRRKACQWKAGTHFVERLTHLLSVQWTFPRHLVHVGKRFDHNTSEHVHKDIPWLCQTLLDIIDMLMKFLHGNDIPTDEQHVRAWGTTAIWLQEVTILGASGYLNSTDITLAIVSRSR